MNDKIKHHPKWVEIFNAAVRLAQDKAHCQRCTKQKWFSTYMGSFVEMDMPYRCLLDAEHDGDCVFRFQDVSDTIVSSERKDR